VVKSITPAMQSHLAQTVTTLASCWKVTRTDGKIFTFTGHDQDLVIGGLVYEAESSFDRSSVESDPTMSVDNLEIQGIFDSAAIGADELRAGLFDHAQVELFLVNWADLTMGRINLRRGWLGEYTLTPSGIFKSEIRGLVQALQQNVGEVYTTQCRADLGDSRCKIPTNPPVLLRNMTVADFSTGPTPNFYRKKDASVPDDHSSVVFHDIIFQCVQAGVTAATDVAYDYTPGASTTDGSAAFVAVQAWSRYGVVSSVSVVNQHFSCIWPYGRDGRVVTGVNPSVAASPDTWFVDGILTWETGLNVGLSMEVQTYDHTTDSFGLHLPMGFPIHVGDKFRVYAGCSKLIGVRPTAIQPTSVFGTFPGTRLTVVDPDGCFPKFNNAVNYRGEPYIPGVDFLVGEASVNKPGFSSGGGKGGK